MTRAVALGVDVSTTELRVHVLDIEAAEQLAVTTANLPPVTGENGRRVQDARYAETALETIARAIHTAGDVEVRAISVTATSGTVVPVDLAGVQRGAAVMYNDTTSAQLDADLTTLAGGRPVSMLSRVAGLLSIDPTLRAASVAGVIESALLGRPVPGDTSHFLKAGVDARRGTLSGALIDRAGLSRSRLPELVPPGTTLGRVRSGPAVGAVVVAGMTDGCTSQLATGTVRVGQSVGVIGTTLVLKVVEEADRFDAETGVYAHRAPDGRYWVGGASNVGGGSLGLPPDTDFADLSDRGERVGSSSVVTYPLRRAGERFPVANPRMTALCVDLSGRSASLPEDLAARYRAVIEGVALVERYALESLGIDPAREVRTLSGGGTRSALWNRIRAATLGARARIPVHRDSGYGAAMLAAWAVSGTELTTEATRLAGVPHVVEPEPALAQAMRVRYEVFLEALQRRGEDDS